jgi:cathepsin L
MKVALIFCVACCLSLSTVAVFDQEWEDWKDLHGKRYSPADEEERHAVWTKNRDFVVQHNKEGHNYTVELNQFADLTSEEFTKLHMSSFNLAKKEEEEGKRWYIPSNLPTLPDEVDWRGKGVVTPIKNQGQCGSCWSFSATGALEGQHALKTGHLISLSEQQLVDCSTTYGNQGCRGGWPYKAFQYIKGVGGIELEKEYPYYAHDERCHANPAEFAANCTGYKDIPSKDENALKVAAATVGPISVAIDASHASFQVSESLDEATNDQSKHHFYRFPL